MSLIGISVVAGIGIVSFSYGVSIYNTINQAKNEYAGMIADLGIEYQRRADVFCNLAKSVKSHKLFEEKTLLELTKARSGLSNNSGVNFNKLKKMDSIFQGMRIQLEAYPELKSGRLYRDLMDEVKLTEERIVLARGELNTIAENFNTYINNFPTNTFAKNLFHARELEYFESEVYANQKPELDL